MFQRFLSKIKASGLSFAGRITDKYEPFDDFTRPAMPKNNETLEQKEEKFWDQMMRNFIINDDTVINYRIPMPHGTPWDVGDQCIWHGVYTAMVCFKFEFTKDQALVPLLENLIQGMWEHQHFHKEAKGRLIRGYRTTDGHWEDDCSNDSAAGHLLGLWACLTYGPSTVKEKARLLAVSLADELIENDYQLINADGSHTKHGVLIDGFKTDPLRLTLTLAILNLAECHKEIDDLWCKYGAMVPYAKARFLGWQKFPDDHRAALQLMILVSSKEVIPHYRWQACLRGLRKMRKIGLKSGNAWVLALCGMVLGESRKDPIDKEIWQKVLSEYTLEDKEPAVERINSSDWEIWESRGITMTRWGSETVSSQPLPTYLRGSQDFFFQRHPWTIDDWKGAHQPHTLHNGGDFLAAYWLGKLVGW